jgi:3'-phosphoadenosine 5'-phosphosulfate sulfotransferase (PAPS reductase)/FAD synthetase
MEYWQLAQKQSLSLNVKIRMSQGLIKRWYEAHEGNVYISFSGGKDSTVLLSLVRGLFPDVPAVFCDTGLEFPEIREFVRTIDNVVWLKPTLNFKQVIEKYGYPIVSKETAHKIDRINRNHNRNVMRMYLQGIMKDGRKTHFIIPHKWRYLLKAPFKISDECCTVMKKRPFKRYERETGRVAFIGTLAVDSRLRLSHYLQYGCNAFNKSRPSSQPLSFWVEADIWNYLRKKKIKYSEIYDKGEERTGCMFCLFGEHLREESRFERMKKNHPKQYRYCMDALNFRKVFQWYPERRGPGG